MGLWRTCPVSTPTEIFEEIDRSLKADPARAAGTNASYVFDLSGDDGGLYHIVLREGAESAGAGGVDGAGVTIAMAAADFVEMRHGRLDPTMAFMSGRVKISGDMRLAMKLPSTLR